MIQIYVDLRSRTPIFEQIVDFVRDAVIHGTVAPDEHLPSVRALAADLGINPNTIQKAYAELERQGVIYSLPGRGNFVASDTSLLHDARKKELMDALSADLAAALDAGIERDALLALFDAAIQSGKGEKV